jgi:hypothetical protein
MFAEEIRALLHNRPFVPFEVYVAETKVLRVPHSDYALINPMGSAMTIMDERGVFNHVNIAHVTLVVPMGQGETAPQG